MRLHDALDVITQQIAMTPPFPSPLPPLPRPVILKLASAAYYDAHRVKVRGRIFFFTGRQFLIYSF